jgi:signal transduction histidine kinase
VAEEARLVPSIIETILLPKRRQPAPSGRIVEEFQHTLALVVEPESLYSSVVRAFQELSDCERLALLLIEPELNVLRPVAGQGFADERFARLRLKPSDKLIAWLRVNEAALEVRPGDGIFRFLSDAEQDTLLRLDVKLCVPLVSMNRIIGLLFMGPRRQGQYGEAERGLLAALASQAALALENALLRRRQVERLRHMYRAERLATAGQLASGVAHEIRNPLTAIRSTVQLLARDVQQDTAKRELLDAVVSEVDRINGIITQLLSFARTSEFRPGSVDLNQVIESSLGLVAAQANLQGVSLERLLETLPPVLGDEAQLKQIFLNLLMNSLQAMPRGGVLKVESGGAEGAGSVCVSITDNGCGMEQDVLDRIFDPFFTTKPDGTGLGLSVTYAILERHKAEISVRSTPGKGTTVVLTFPMR